jgi:predicted nucleic acid-binding protein
MRKPNTPPSGARRRKSGRAENEWQLQEAKARFSEVFRLARERGPQGYAGTGHRWLLAATALHHNLTLVTRNTPAVEATGVPVLNPWR